MHGASRTFLAACFAILVSACGGGNSAAPPSSSNFDLQAGIAKMVTNGLSANVNLSGTVSVNGVSTAFAGTLTRPPAFSATFTGTAAMSQTTTVAESITAAGQATPYSTSVTDYYASS